MKYSKKILANGLRLVTVPMPQNPTVTVLVLVEAGSKYENKKNNGISHFLEHMCFKGTKRRPKAIDISRELDSIGSQYNAFTAQEYTGYYAKAEAKHFSKILDVVSDIYLNSTFPVIELEKEKGVIIEEINVYRDMPPQHIQDLIMQLLYGNQPAGWNIAGTKESVSRMTQKDFIDYKDKHYLPKLTTVVVAGKISEKKVLIEIQKIFGQIKNNKAETKIKTTEGQNKPQILSQIKNTDQTHFVLAVRTFDLFNKLNPVLTVLGATLAGGMSSRLFQKLREEMGVAYYVRAFNEAYTDHGFFQISAGVDNKRLEEVLEAILGECRKLKKELISAAELKKVKDYLTGNLKLSLESTDEIANFLGGQELLKKKISLPEEKTKEIQKVTPSQIQTLAKKIFTNKNLNLALIGPERNQKKILQILKF